jgi:hypothetical protein
LVFLSLSAIGCSTGDDPDGMSHANVQSCTGDQCPASGDPMLARGCTIYLSASDPSQTYSLPYDHCGLSAAGEAVLCTDEQGPIAIQPANCHAVDVCSSGDQIAVLGQCVYSLDQGAMVCVQQPDDGSGVQRNDFVPVHIANCPNPPQSCTLDGSVVPSDEVTCYYTYTPVGLAMAWRCMDGQTRRIDPEECPN